MFKDKILAAIKAKFPKVNLSKARLTQIAAFIEKKVIDDETKIDAALDEFNEFNPLSELAKQDDEIRNLQAKLNKTAPAKKDEKVDEPPASETDITVNDDTPAWAKLLIESNKKVSEKLAALEGEKVANTMKEKATAALKDIPVSYWGKRVLPVKEEDLDAFIEEVKADYTEFTTAITDKGLQVVQNKPQSGNAGGADGSDKDKASEKEVAAVVDQIT